MLAWVLVCVVAAAVAVAWVVLDGLLAMILNRASSRSSSSVEHSTQRTGIFSTLIRFCCRCHAPWKNFFAVIVIVTISSPHLSFFSAPLLAGCFCWLVFQGEFYNAIFFIVLVERGGAVQVVICGRDGIVFFSLLVGVVEASPSQRGRLVIAAVVVLSNVVVVVVPEPRHRRILLVVLTGLGSSRRPVDDDVVVIDKKRWKKA